MTPHLKFNEWQAMIRLPYYVFIAACSRGDRKLSSSIDVFIAQMSDYARDNKGTLYGQLIADALLEHDSILTTTLKMNGTQILDESRMAIFRLRETLDNEARLRIVGFLKQLYSALGGTPEGSSLAHAVNQLLQLEATVTV